MKAELAGGVAHEGEIGSGVEIEIEWFGECRYRFHDGRYQCQYRSRGVSEMVRETVRDAAVAEELVALPE